MRADLREAYLAVKARRRRAKTDRSRSADEANPDYMPEYRDAVEKAKKAAQDKLLICAEPYSRFVRPADKRAS
jgi:hypothetical protein